MTHDTTALCKRLAEGVMGLEQHCHCGRLTWCKRLIPGGDCDCRVEFIAQPEMAGRSWTACDVSGEHEVWFWRPDTDIAQAMMVAERIVHGDGPCAAISIYAVPHHSSAAWGWTVGFRRSVHAPQRTDPDTIWERHDSLPMAICLAADAWLRQGGGG